ALWFQPKRTWLPGRKCTERVVIDAPKLRYRCYALAHLTTARPVPARLCTASLAGAAASGVGVRTSEVSVAASRVFSDGNFHGNNRPSGIDGDIGLFIGRGFGQLLADYGDQVVELGFAAVE